MRHCQDIGLEIQLGIIDQAIPTRRWCIASEQRCEAAQIGMQHSRRVVGVVGRDSLVLIIPTGSENLERNATMVDDVPVPWNEPRYLRWPRPAAKLSQERLDLGQGPAVSPSGADPQLACVEAAEDLIDSPVMVVVQVGYHHCSQALDSVRGAIAERNPRPSRRTVDEDCLSVTCTVQDKGVALTDIEHCQLRFAAHSNSSRRSPPLIQA
jgi:hypothetical protein